MKMTLKHAQSVADFLANECGVRFPISSGEAIKYRGVGYKTVEFFSQMGLLKKPISTQTVIQKKCQELRKSLMFHQESVGKITKRLREYESQIHSSSTWPPT